MDKPIKVHKNPPKFPEKKPKRQHQRIDKAVSDMGKRNLERARCFKVLARIERDQAKAEQFSKLSDLFS